jgi:hypothetical protein
LVERVDRHLVLGSQGALGRSDRDAGEDADDEDQADEREQADRPGQIAEQKAGKHA